MRILITGAFGNVGAAAVDEALHRGHEVEIFDLHGKRTDAAARRYLGKVRAIHFGDIRTPDDVAAAVQEADAVIHLAAVIPPTTERNPELCREVNVGGTANLIAAVNGRARKPAFVYVSSASVLGPTQHLGRPVRADDPVNPTDNYSRSKEEAERLTRAALEDFCIVRLAAVIPAVVRLGSQMQVLGLLFDMPLHARCEIVMDLDVAAALVSACEDLRTRGLTRGKTLILGGGRENGCQVTTEELVRGLMSSVGLALPDRSLFNPDVNGYYLNWYDTEESQRLLGFQRHSFSQIKASMARRFRALKPFIRLLAPLIMRRLERMSPLYYSARG